MNHQEMEKLLAVRTEAAARENVSLVLSPHIQRNAARLRKRRKDRIQTLLCALAGIVFLAAAGGILYVLKTADNPQNIMRGVLYIALGGMALTLLAAPVLVWYSEKEGNT